MKASAWVGTVCLAILGSISLVNFAGCASPGVPLPPSLMLPAVATDLSVMRVGDEVKLRWTTPAKTTDRMRITGPVTAEICRDAGAALPAVGCTVVSKLTVRPGASEGSDVLPSAVVTGPPQLLAYRVQLRNAAGKTAGPSNAAYAASGAAPDPIAALRGKATKAGALLEWTAESETSMGVELEKVVVKPPPATAKIEGNGNKNLFGGAPTEPVDSLLRVGIGIGDPGGTLDRTVKMGESYRYTAARVRTLTLSGKTVEVKGVPSAGVTVVMLDVFPPEVPAGLVASPGFAGDGTDRKPAIDLNWEPVLEAGVAGYRVYRRERDGDWKRVSEGLVAVPAYRDATVVSGNPYSYRVTAVDAAGNESGPSGVVVETGPSL